MWNEQMKAENINSLIKLARKTLEKKASHDSSKVPQIQIKQKAQAQVGEEKVLTPTKQVQSEIHCPRQMAIQSSPDKTMVFGLDTSEKDEHENRAQTSRNKQDSQSEGRKVCLSHWMTLDTRENEGESREIKESSCSKINFDLSKDNETCGLNRSKAENAGRASETSLTSIGKFTKKNRRKMVSGEKEKSGEIEHVEKTKEETKKKPKLIEIKSILDMSSRKNTAKGKFTEKKIKE